MFLNNSLKISNAFLLKSCPFSILSACNLYDKSKFGIRELDSLRKKTLEGGESAESIEDLRVRIRKLVDKEKAGNESSNNTVEATLDDLNRFLLISQNKADLELSLEALKRYKRLFLVDGDQRFGEKFIKMCFILNVPGKISELIETDKEIEMSFLGRLSSFLIMNELVEKQEYAKAVAVFDAYVRHLEQELAKTEVKPSILNKRKNISVNDQPISLGLLRLAIHSLFKINTKESYTKMKELLNTAAKFNSTLTNTSISVCFLFAIQQNDFDYAYKLTFKTVKYNQSLIHNLRAIALCNLNRVEEAYYFIETILAIKLVSKNPKSPIEGKVFPMTLREFKKAIEKQKDLQSKGSKYKLICEKMEKRLYEKDLEEYGLWADRDQPNN